MRADSIDEKSLGKLLAQARRGAGLTQQELCHKAGLSYSTLAKIERGAIKTPSVFTIASIAQALGTTLDGLMGIGSVSGKPKKRSRRGVKFVYFDINGCLVRFYHQAFSDIAKDNKLSVDEVQTAFWRHNNLACKGEMSLDKLNQSIAKDLGLKSLDFRRYYMKAAKPITETHELLEWAAEHYYVGLLSNIMPGFIPEMIGSGLIPAIDYDAVTDSSVVGAIKPESKIYEIAEQKSGHAASEILFIDDSRTNLAPASARGWHVLWFDTTSPAESVASIRQALEPA